MLKRKPLSNKEFLRRFRDRHPMDADIRNSDECGGRNRPVHFAAVLEQSSNRLRPLNADLAEPIEDRREDPAA